LALRRAGSEQGAGFFLALYDKYIVGIKTGAGNFSDKIPVNSIYRVLVVCIVDQIVGELGWFRDLKRNERSI